MHSPGVWSYIASAFQHRLRVDRNVGVTNATILPNMVPKLMTRVVLYWLVTQLLSINRKYCSINSNTTNASRIYIQCMYTLISVLFLIQCHRLCMVHITVPIRPDPPTWQHGTIQVHRFTAILKYFKNHRRHQVVQPTRPVLPTMPHQRSSSYRWIRSTERPSITIGKVMDRWNHLPISVVQVLSRFRPKYMRIPVRRLPTNFNWIEAHHQLYHPEDKWYKRDAIAVVQIA